MLKIRLSRIGKRNTAHFRIVVMPEHSKRNGKVVEQIGYYNPRTKEIKVNLERTKYWLSVGAQVTDTVHGILVKQKLLKPKTRSKRPPRKPKKAKEGAEEKAKKKVAQVEKKESTPKAKSSSPVAKEETPKKPEPKQAKTEPKTSKAPAKTN